MTAPPRPDGIDPALRRKILLLAVLPLVAAVVFIALTVRLQATDLAARERKLVESAYLASKEAELRGTLDLALSVILPIYEGAAGGTPEQEAQAQAQVLRILNALRYSSGDGYFFAYRYDGHCLVHPTQPELVGRNLWSMRDRDGRAVIQSLIELAQGGGGVLRYVWNKPSRHQVTPKLGRVTGLERWQWMLGTGLYLDDVQGTLDQLDHQGQQNIHQTLGWIAAIALLAVVLVGGSALAVNLSETRAADAQLKLMARKVVQSQELERAHLSRELHDSTSQTLVSVKLLMDSAMRSLRRQEDREVPPTLLQARQRVDEALTEVRHISHRLRPAMLDALGLPAALRQIGEEFAEHTELVFSMRQHGQADNLPDTVKTTLFRVTQEAFTNIDRHAHATRVDLRLIHSPYGVRLSIVDDGEGFDVDAVQDDPHRGIGMRNMRERLEAVGGRLRIVSALGRTRVTADVPARALAAAS